jgi:hypothetical protein
MASSKVKAKPTSLAEERIAREAEQKRPTRPISHHGLKKWTQAHEIREEMKPMDARLKELQAQLYKEMDNKGVDVLTHQGVEIFSRDEVTGAEQFDMESFKKDHPLLYKKYYRGKKANYFRVNWKTFIHFIKKTG